MKKWIAAAATSFALSTAAWGWGSVGHATIGQIADQNLTPAAQTAVQALLQGDLTAAGQPSGRSTLSAVASWADEIRPTPASRPNWHFHDNPVCSAAPGPCPNGECVDVEIGKQLQILRDSTADHRARNEALKWLVHLVGDIHQPLHVAENQGDRGGNELKVALAGIKTKGAQNLHKVWDTALAEIALRDMPLPTIPVGFMPGNPADWMQEGRRLAADVAYAAVPGFSCGQADPTGIVLLDAGYQQQAEQVIRERVSWAGLRLAALLNQLYR